MNGSQNHPMDGRHIRLLIRSGLMLLVAGLLAVGGSWGAKAYAQQPHGPPAVQSAQEGSPTCIVVSGAPGQAGESPSASDTARRPRERHGGPVGAGGQRRSS